jgi:hypothetical protein
MEIMLMTGRSISPREGRKVVGLVVSGMWRFIGDYQCGTGGSWDLLTT